MLARLLCAPLLAIASAILPVASVQARDVVIHAGTLFDGLSDSPRGKSTIVVRDDRIIAVRDGFVTPDDADVIDLADSFVLPGFIDVHTHVTGGPNRDRLRGTAEQQAFQSVWNMRAILDAGFTSIRDVSGNIEVLRALREAVDTGLVTGPRLWISGRAISPTGGHSDHSNGIDPRWNRSDDWKLSIIDGPVDGIRAVRELHKRGMDYIKVHVTGGVASVNDNPHIQLMRDDELEAIVSTAHTLGMKVAAHAHGKVGIDAAVRAGVDSIEHGTYADAESYRLMKRHRVYLVPTLFAAQEIYDIAKDSPAKLPPTVVQKAISVTPIMRGNAGAAYIAGVKMALGTDQLGWLPHGQNAKEFEYLVSAGVRPSDAILMATRHSADLLGRSSDVGAVEAGRYADIVAVKGDPLADISSLQRVHFVMKSGKIVKKETMRFRGLRATK